MNPSEAEATDTPRLEEPGQSAISADPAAEFILERGEYDGVLVRADEWERIDEYFRTWEELEYVATWGEFRQSVIDFDVVSMELDAHELDLRAYLDAIEHDNAIVHPAGGLEARWVAAGSLPFAGRGTWGEVDVRSNDALPADGDAYERRFFSEYGDEMDRSIRLAATMLDCGLPKELFDEFGLIDDTTLDGYLGRIPEEDIDAVVARARELGLHIREA